MKSTRSTAKKVAPSGKKSAGLKPLPIPRLRPISAARLMEFERKYGPKANARPVDAVATLIRLRRGEA